MRLPGSSIARLLLSALLLAGCQVDQKKEVATYRDVVDMPGAGVPDNPLTPLTLREALLTANRDNERLSIEGEAYLRTLIQRRRAVANFLPTVNLVPIYTQRDPVSNSDDNGNGGSSSQDHTFDVPAELNINLFNGFRDVNAYWRDTYLIERQRQLLLAGQETLLLDVAQVYYQIMRSEASVRVLENSLAVQEERLRDTRGRYEAGLARPLDVAQTEAQTSATRIVLIRARNDVHDARALLSFLINADIERRPLADAFDLPSRVEALQGYFDLASDHRNELAAAAGAILAARREVEVAFGQYYPSVSLDFTSFLYRESIPDDRRWDALLVANIPLFAAGRIHADVREAWSFFREALLVQSFLQRQVRQQVQTAYQDLAASEARLAELQVALGAAQLAFNQSEESYRVGLATNLDRVTAQDALLEAQLATSSEEFDRKVLYLNLLRFAGVLREELEALPTTRPAMESPTTLPAAGPRGPLMLQPSTRPSTAPATLPARISSQ